MGKMKYYFLILRKSGEYEFTGINGKSNITAKLCNIIEHVIWNKEKIAPDEMYLPEFYKSDIELKNPDTHRTITLKNQYVFYAETKGSPSEEILWWGLGIFNKNYIAIGKTPDCPQDTLLLGVLINPTNVYDPEVEGYTLISYLSGNTSSLSEIEKEAFELVDSDEKDVDGKPIFKPNYRSIAIYKARLKALARYYQEKAESIIVPENEWFNS